MKPKSKNFIIPLVIYPFDVMVSINETDKQLVEVLDKFGIPKESQASVIELRETVQARTEMFPGNQTLIRFMTNPSTDIIAHEVFHAVTFIMSRIGMKFKLLTSDEAYAYLIGYLVKEINKRL